jgi:hypothetical protein
MAISWSESARAVTNSSPVMVTKISIFSSRRLHHHPKEGAQFSRRSRERLQAPLPRTTCSPPRPSMILGRSHQDSAGPTLRDHHNDPLGNAHLGLPASPTTAVPLPLHGIPPCPGEKPENASSNSETSSVGARKHWVRIDAARKFRHTVPLLPEQQRNPPRPEGKAVAFFFRRIEGLAAAVGEHADQVVSDVTRGSLLGEKRLPWTDAPHPDDAVASPERSSSECRLAVPAADSWDSSGCCKRVSD